MTTNIQKDNNIATLINVFTVDPSSQQRLVNMLIETTKQVMKKQEGFISANIQSLDGTRVVNYAQWDSKEAFEKRLRNPKAIVHMNEVLSIAKSVEGSLYEVAFVDERGSIA